jgi:hypothetical protein
MWAIPEVDCACVTIFIPLTEMSNRTTNPLTLCRTYLPHREMRVFVAILHRKQVLLTVVHKVEHILQIHYPEN